MEINLVAVILAALSAFFLGYLWYTVVFAKPWQKEIGLALEGTDTANVKTPDLGKLLAGSFLLELLMAFVMARFFVGTEAEALGGLKAGFLIGLLVASAFGVNYLFEGKSLKHWVINATYNVVVFSVMGLIIGAF